jgi:hypothetical protein
VTFKKAVEEPPSVADAWCSGLGALRRGDKGHIEAEDTRRLRGSVDVDTALKPSCPDEPRWDYAIGHKPSNPDTETVYWVEIHPASSGEVKAVLEKLAWLKAWLRKAAPKLNALHREFIWVSSGKTSFTLSSPQLKQFAQHGLQHKGRVFKIPSKPTA